MHLNRVAGDADDTLNDCLTIWGATGQLPKQRRWVEDHHFTSLWRSSPFGNLLDGKLVVDVKGRIHGERRDIPGFDDSEPNRQEKGESGEKFFGKLYQLAFSFFEESYLLLEH